MGKSTDVKDGIQLSSYIAANEKKWRAAEHTNIQRLMSYLEGRIDVDLYDMAKTTDKIEAFRRLEGWMLNFYPAELLDGLDHIGFDYQEYQKKLICSLILAVTRGRANMSMLRDILKSRGIITGILDRGRSEYEIISESFGNIPFRKADGIIDRETQKYLEMLGEQVVDGCHEISLFMIKNNPGLKAVTSVCRKGLGCNYYHSFVLDTEDNVIDLTANLVMPKEQYYLLYQVNELNVADYEKCLAEEKTSLKYDESKTLYALLRNATYRQALAEERRG